MNLSFVNLPENLPHFRSMRQGRKSDTGFSLCQDLRVPPQFALDCLLRAKYEMEVIVGVFTARGDATVESLRDEDGI